jgi:GAF domain-containing protein
MPKAQLATETMESELEAARLTALVSTGILDTEPEPSYDAITRLAAEYFRADSAGIGFADESRIWIKSSWGRSLRELPRKDSIFDRVLAQNGPLVISIMSKAAEIEQQALLPRLFGATLFAAVPVRSFDGKILGILTIFFRHPRG